MLKRTKFPFSPLSKNPTPVRFGFWWFPPCPAYQPLPYDCVSPWQRERGASQPEISLTHMSAPPPWLQRCPGGAPPAHPAALLRVGSVSIPRAAAAAVGAGGLLKSLEVAATLPAPCFGAVVNSRGVRRLQMGRGGKDSRALRTRSPSVAYLGAPRPAQLPLESIAAYQSRHPRGNPPLAQK